MNGINGLIIKSEQPSSSAEILQTIANIVISMNSLFIILELFTMSEPTEHPNRFHY